MLKQLLSRPQNTLLDGLPPREWEQLQPDLQLVAMTAQATLHRSHEPIEHAHFPLGGCVSLLMELSDGFSAAVAQIGSEGVVGSSLVLGHAGSPAVARVQIAGTALRIGADTLVKQLARLPALRQRLLYQAGVQAARSMQLTACNAHHGMDARLARCLLGLQDHAGGRAIEVTHEGLAALLCAHRPSISVSLKRLQQRGLMQQHMGSIAVTDRAGLERASCECYAVVRDLRAEDEHSE